MGLHMPILAVAFGIYIFGVSFVLYFRPNIMFKNSGTWKEFGIGRGNEHTVIPFWLFAIFWAFISYGIALVVMSQFASIALNAFPDSAPQMNISGQIPPPQISTQLPSLPPQQFIKPVSSSFGINPGNPGYYVLQSVGNGVPQYIYYGQNPPPIVQG
jgi:hypothetical protein